jgi:Tol biopolymer transport system component
VWTPDAKTIYFGSNGKGSMHVYAKAADGSGPEQVVREEDAFDWPEDVSLVRRLSECFAMTDDGFCTA